MSRFQPKLLLNVDEVGDPGKKSRGHTHYIMAGCLVVNRAGFEWVTERYGLDAELKFHDFPLLREEIVTDAKEYVASVFFTQFSKKKYRWDGTGNKKKLHMNLLYSLVYGVLDCYHGQAMDFIVDHNTIIDDEEVRALIRETATTFGVRANPVVGDSVSDYGLQTNDFFVGSIGYRYNHPYVEGEEPSNRYTSLFKEKLIEVPYRKYLAGDDNE